MIDLTALRAELTTDPQAVGYAAHYAAGDDYTLAQMLNATTGAGAASVPLIAISRGAFLRSVIPGTDRLAAGLDSDGAALTSATITKWTYRFNAARGGDETIALDAAMLGMLGQMVTDKIMTQAEIDAFTTRTGSRAEVLFGAGTVIAVDDVSRTRSV